MGWTLEKFLRLRPVKVRINQTLSPVDLLTFSIRRGVELRGVRFQYHNADSMFRGRSGDGDDVPGPIAEHGTFDFLVTDTRSKEYVLSFLEFARVLTIRPDGVLVIVMSWDSDGSPDSAGSLCVAWSHRARLQGARPIVAHGKAAQALGARLTRSNPPSLDWVTWKYERVRAMSKRDAIQRRKRAREKDDVTQIPSVPPRIESLSVEGLRGFREKATLKLASPTGESGSGLTIVVGANNAGKSTLWESFDALARKSKSDISFSEGKRNRGSAFGVTISLTREDGSTYALQSQRADSSETLGQWISPSASTGSTGLEIVTVPSRRQFQSTFSKQIASERDWMISGGDYSRSQSRDQFTGRMFDLHSDNAKKAAFDDLMARVLGYPFDWTIDLADGQYGGSYYLKISTGEGSTHTSEGLGDGIISLLFIINALYDSLPGTLIVLDEPELSLHPQLVRRLGREIARFARDRQIVVLTHSPLLVSWADISAGAEIARVYKLGSNSTIAQPSRHAVEKISEHRNDWRNPHVLGVDAAEALFLDDGVIVVEGQEDAALLPRVFELADVPQKGVVYGWGSGGAGNVQKVLALLAGLGFKKVAAVIDGNVPDTASALERQFPGFHVATIPADDIRTKPAAGDKAEVRGLLDSHGRSIDTELLAPTRVVLEGVNRYFAEASPAAGFPANKHSSQAEVAS